MEPEGTRGAYVERLLSVREARDVLGVSSQTLYRLIGRGDLPVIKIGVRTLIRPSDLEEFVRRSTRIGAEAGAS